MALQIESTLGALGGNLPSLIGQNKIYDSVGLAKGGVFSGIFGDSGWYALDSSSVKEVCHSLMQLVLGLKYISQSAYFKATAAECLSWLEGKLIRITQSDDSPRV